MKLFVLNIRILIITSLTVLNNSPIFSAELRNDRPLWSQVDTLICSSQSMMDCMKGKCETRKPNAIWKIDFPNKKIEFLTSIKMIYSIRQSFFEYYNSIKESKHVIFLNGRIMDFNLDEKTTLGEINAQLVGGNWNNNKLPVSTQMTFKCHVQ